MSECIVLHSFLGVGMHGKCLTANPRADPMRHYTLCLVGPCVAWMRLHSGTAPNNRHLQRLCCQNNSTLRHFQGTTMAVSGGTGKSPQRKALTDMP